MGGVSAWVLRHRRLVLLGWLLVFVAGIAATGGITNRLSFAFSLPGQPGYETDAAILKAYGTGGGQAPVVPVLRLPAGTTIDSPGVAAKVGGAFAAATTAGHGGPPFRVVDYATTGDRHFVARDGRSTFALVFVPQPNGFSADAQNLITPAVQKAAPPGATVASTGIDVLGSGGGSSGGPGVLTETLLGGVGALLVLAFVFASFIAVMPLLMAMVAIPTTFLIVTALTTFTDVSFIVQFLVALIGLGVAIDYSLLIVTRWREERAHGRSNVDAVQAAMETAGHAVLFSGLTVAIGLFALVFLPVPFLRSVGYGGMLIPLVSVIVAATLLPVLLATVGPFLDRPHIRHDDQVSRGWAAWSRFVVRRRWPVAVVALGFLVALLIPALAIRVGEPRTDALAKSGPAYDALQTMKAGGTPTGALTPIEVLVRSGDPRAAVSRLATLPGVTTAALGTPAGAATAARPAIVEVLPAAETSSGSGASTVRRVKAEVRSLPGSYGVGGSGAEQIDFNKAVYGTFPLMLAVIVVVTFLLLARAFRSVLLPLKAVLLNLLSVGATYGFLVLFWQDGHGSQAIFGIAPTGAITNFIPLMVFAFLFGLSMDYEVFILSRMREEYDATGSTTLAVEEGMGRTGRLVTSAALILFLAFLSLASGPETDIKIFATGLGVGILLDATIVRALLVPALVSLLGRWNWWMPAGFATVLRVTPSAAVPEPRGRDVSLHKVPVGSR